MGRRQGKTGQGRGQGREQGRGKDTVQCFTVLYGGGRARQGREQGRGPDLRVICVGGCEHHGMALDSPHGRRLEVAQHAHQAVLSTVQTEMTTVTHGMETVTHGMRTGTRGMGRM